MSLFHSQPGSGQPHRLVADNLKRCPLCGALNSELNTECFVCSWHGTFERDPDVVQAGLAELLNRCPELRETLAIPSAGPKQGWKLWVARAKRLFRRRLDIRI